MGTNDTARQHKPTTFLGALRSDVRGNTLAIMAAALIPFVGLVGGGVDLARMYITKTRLQHACDAGALAGRKAMGGGTWAQDNYAPRTSANEFFTGNFADKSYGSLNKKVSYDESAGKVTGSASVDLPMSLMQVFGFGNQNIAVNCSAEMRLPNTDVMFVLDTTGSMGDKASSKDKDSKIVGLRAAVKCFYEIVARFDTDEDCGSTPSGGTSDQIQIRFGFVPYAMNVNVKNVIPTTWFADKWKYQTRLPTFKTSTAWVQVSSSSSSEAASMPNVYQGDCNDAKAAGLNSSSESVSGDGKTKVQTDVTYKTSSWSGAKDKPGTCYGTKTTTKTNFELRTTNGAFDGWQYGYLEQNVSGLKNGDDFDDHVDLPIGSNGSSYRVDWDGCVEERASDYDANVSESDKIDAMPTNDATRWGPALRDAIFTRKGYNQSDWDAAPIAKTTSSYSNGSTYTCPSPAVKLRKWSSASDFDDYVDKLTPNGNTYHDIGLLWGARLMSPTGIFKNENATTPKGGKIARHVIFMTDGDTNAQVGDYIAYGVPWFDRRQTTSSKAPSKADLDAVVNARFLSICNQIKNMDDTTLWVISFGNGSNADTEKRLKQCATSEDNFSTARSSDTLLDTFKKIANQISQLRLTK